MSNVGKMFEQTCIQCGAKVGIDVSPHNSHARIIRKLSPSIFEFRLLWRCPSCTWYNETEAEVNLDPRKALGY